MRIADLPTDVVASLRHGTVIPAMPLALHADRTLDERRQRALVRYYIDAGAGGIAAGVHSTEFEIRDPDVALFEPVLALVARAADEWCARRGRSILKVAGVCGRREQALREAEFARAAGYHAALVSLAAVAGMDVDGIVDHCRAVAETMPIIGFYLQPAVGGRVLPYTFWRRFAAIENVLAIKIAPFNRYQTLDVVRAVCDAAGHERIALYTGNDDNIVPDLLTEFRIPGAGGVASIRIRGGLLGHWSVWTRGAVELLDTIRGVVDGGGCIPSWLLSRGAEVTDANAAFFDAANGFAGCIPGIHEVLRRQGLLEGRWCLSPGLDLSPGQAGEIDRICRSYPHLADDAFVAAHLGEWLADAPDAGR